MSSSTAQLLVAALRSQNIQDHLFPHLSTADLCSLRRASSACCNLLTKPLFTRITVTFTASTFTKQSRLAALSRVGQHVEHLTFHFSHSDSTFLPPLVHPATGEEICFLYTPHTSMDSALTRPKYANSELGDILTQQYPPLFHAATNVPSFIHAMTNMPNLRHLTVRCPGQNPAERYRRDIVDYALISLRIAVERAPLTKLHKLSLSLHPSALNYLRHVTGFGSVPSAGRRWKQIRKLHMAIESWDFYGPSPGLDHLKIIDDYIRTLSPTLEKLSFTWLGGRGPCPIALFADPLFAPPRASKKLFHEVTSPMSPLPCRPARSPIRIPNLRHLQIRNAVMNACQLKDLIASHRDTVKEFDFDNVYLGNNAAWEDALAPVDNDRTWSRSSRINSYDCGPVSSDDELPSPSAAVSAVGRELFEHDIGGFPFGFGNESVGDFPCDASVSRQSTLSFSTTLKKKRGKRRRLRRPDEHHDKTSGDERPVTPKSCRSERPVTPKSSHSDRPVTPKRSPSTAAPTTPTRPSRGSYSSREESMPRSPPSPSAVLSNRSGSPRYRKPSVSTIPEVVSAPIPIPDANISSPILVDDPQPVLLQPAVYDPKNPFNGIKGISSVQRNIEQEEAHRMMAEDAEARGSALQRAKEAVINKLGREFSVKKNVKGDKISDAGAVAACRSMANRDFMSGRCSDEVLEDTYSMNSRTSMLVPLMFARG
ncbi:hypothetical protein VHEMI02605 [[Torrubiella] hemipterigena]|uniref:F-box domain-containing protein n=1 Tax=[Torrubiella] hemipterigena TaxID=1531966 RepID=A0A0A1SW97_9HYPO|nr:hypothetical protein VHEMI02605 [[Torrubiella] hemipterigena]